MGYVKCNLCEADDYKVLWAKGYTQKHQIVKCNRCGLMYANPQDVVDSVKYQTDSFYKESGYSLTYDTNKHYLYFEKQQNQLPDNLKTLQVLNKYSPNRGKLLEIGSYLGIFLDQIRTDGWDVTGLEIDKSALNYCRSKYGLNIIEGTLDRACLPEKEFDAVVLLHVIEHMPDPSKDLNEIYRIIKQGGILVVETPRFDSLLFKIFKHRERSIRNCDGHIYFFTVPQLRQLLEKANFEIIRIEKVGRTLSLERFIWNIEHMFQSKLLRILRTKFRKILFLDKIRFHINTRDMQRVYCRAK